MLTCPEGEALLLYKKICDLPEPDAFKVRILSNWLRVGDFPIHSLGLSSWGELLKGRGRPPLLSQFWRLIRTIFWERDSDKLDLGLVAPNRKMKSDSLTRWAYNEGLPFWENCVASWRTTATSDTLPSTGDLSGTTHQTRSTFSRFLSRRLRKQPEPKQDPESLSLARYRIHRLLPVARVLVAFAGISTGLLPIIAIVVLSKVQKQQVLGFIALFTSLFVLGLMFLTLMGKTEISKLDVFTASAA